MGPLPKMEKLKKQRILLGIEQELGEELACKLLYGMVQKEIRAPMLSKVLNKSIEESVFILRNLFSDHAIDGGGSYNFSDAECTAVGTGKGSPDQPPAHPLPHPSRHLGQVVHQALDPRGFGCP